jgi:hypothetical protein
MVASGNEIAEISEGETAKIRALGEDVTAEWVTEVTDRGLDGAALVDDARAAMERYRGTTLPAN